MELNLQLLRQLTSFHDGRILPVAFPLRGAVLLVTVLDTSDQVKVLNYGDLKLDMVLRHLCGDECADVLYVVGGNDVDVVALTTLVALLALLHTHAVCLPEHED